MSTTSQKIMSHCSGNIKWKYKIYAEDNTFAGSSPLCCCFHRCSKKLRTSAVQKDSSLCWRKSRRHLQSTAAPSKLREKSTCSRKIKSQMEKISPIVSPIMPIIMSIIMSLIITYVIVCCASHRYTHHLAKLIDRHCPLFGIGL